jgi:hypothetical protein
MNVNKLKPIRTMLFTNVRNEPNIKEWCIHHQLLGFDYICIFDHKSDIPLQQKDFRFIPKLANRIQIIPCSWNNPIKIPLMKQAVHIANQLNIDWMLYLDADEFLVLNSCSHIKKMLNIFKNADSLAINWLMFGSNNHIKEPSGYIIENYTKSDLYLNKHVKSFVRPKQVINVTNPHFFHIKNSQKRISVQGNRINHYQPEFNESACSIEYSKSHAYIAHYVFQSEETYNNRKINLPRDDTGTFRTKDLDFHTKHNQVDNLLIKNKYLTNIKRFLEPLEPSVENENH